MDSEKDIGKKVFDWFADNERAEMRDGVTWMGPGNRDPDEPFDEFLDGLAKWIDERLVALGYPPASNGNWADVRRSAATLRAELPSPARVLANLAGRVQSVQSERDQNRRLNLAVQLGWDAAVEKGGRVLGPHVARGKRSHAATKSGGSKTQQRDTPHILRKIADRIPPKGKQSVRQAAVGVARDFLPNASREELERTAEKFRSRWYHHKNKL